MTSGLGGRTVACGIQAFGGRRGRRLQFEGDDEVEIEVLGGIVGGQDEGHPVAQGDYLGVVDGYAPSVRQSEGEGLEWRSMERGAQGVGGHRGLFLVLVE